MGIIGLVCIGGLVLFGFLLYATIKTKTTNLNKYEPFNEWIGKTVILNKQTVLFKDKMYMNGNSDYPYALLDSMHPQWQYIEERKNLSEPDLEEITTFPAGTELRLEKAIQYTNGVSGSSYPTIFGSIRYHGETHKIGYQWGTMDLGKRFDKVEKCWQFHQAPWQEKADTAFYALPTANFW